MGVVLSHFSYGFQTQCKGTTPVWSNTCSQTPPGAATTPLALTPPFLWPCIRNWGLKESFTDLKAVLLSSKHFIFKAKILQSFYFRDASYTIMHSRFKMLFHSINTACIPLFTEHSKYQTISPLFLLENTLVYNPIPHQQFSWIKKKNHQKNLFTLQTAKSIP